MTTPKSTANSGPQTIEQLQQRYQQLQTQKIQSETKLGVATKQLEALKGEARKSFGTDDIAELRHMLQTMKAENEQKRAAYQADLERIESELAAVEEKFSAAEAATAKGAS